jgi:hypothetical protein
MATIPPASAARGVGKRKRRFREVREVRFRPICSMYSMTRLFRWIFRCLGVIRISLAFLSPENDKLVRLDLKFHRSESLRRRRCGRAPLSVKEVWAKPPRHAVRQRDRKFSAFHDGGQRLGVGSGSLADLLNGAGRLSSGNRQPRSLPPETLRSPIGLVAVSGDPGHPRTEARCLRTGHAGEPRTRARTNLHCSLDSDRRALRKGAVP